MQSTAPIVLLCYSAHVIRDVATDDDAYVVDQGIVAVGVKMQCHDSSVSTLWNRCARHSQLLSGCLMLHSIGLRDCRSASLAMMSMTGSATLSEPYRDVGVLDSPLDKA